MYLKKKIMKSKAMLRMLREYLPINMVGDVEIICIIEFIRVEGMKGAYVATAETAAEDG